jgi:hypothetical protein
LAQMDRRGKTRTRIVVSGKLLEDHCFEVIFLVLTVNVEHVKVTGPRDVEINHASASPRGGVRRRSPNGRINSIRALAGVSDLFVVSPFF